jgi:starvation-inducible DNA-binding protein
MRGEVMQAVKTKTTNTDVGLAPEGAEAIAEKLNGYLADVQVLYAKLHNFHWNIEGESFFTLHEELQEIYESVAEEIDDVAERVLQIGHRPLTRLADYPGAARLEESESRPYTGREIAEALVSDYKAVIAELRELIKVAQEHEDEGTADEAVGWMKDKEKTTWMLTAYLS